MSHQCFCKICCINPRRACARVSPACVCVCVCVSVCLSVTALAATVSVYTCNQRHPWVSLRLYLILNVWNFEKPFRSRVMACQYANKLGLTASRFRAVSGPTKHSSYVKGNWWVEFASEASYWCNRRRALYAHAQYNTDVNVLTLQRILFVIRRVYVFTSKLSLFQRLKCVQG